MIRQRKKGETVNESIPSKSSSLTVTKQRSSGFPFATLFWLLLYVIALLYATTFTFPPNREEQPTLVTPPVSQPSIKRLNLLFEAKKLLKRIKKPNHKATVTTMVTKAFPTAFSEPKKLSNSDKQILQEFSKRALAVTFKDKNITTYFPRVQWGGTVAWFEDAMAEKPLDDLDAIQGGHLLYSYYRIMQTHMKDPNDLSKDVYFPFKLCKTGCPAERAIVHTLEWRLVYQPFKVTPSCLVENKDGFVYHRGMAHSANNNFGGHAMIWNRSGRHKAKDPLAYFRCILNAADRAVADALVQSKGHVGKFNVVVDAAGYSWGNLPALQYIKQAVTMLQDHFPDRLGAVLLVNLSRTAEFVINVIKPLLTKEVREKLYILPHEPHKLLEALESIVDKEFIPEWLGGSDSKPFDVESYYPTSMRITEAEGNAFIKAMPYHS